ncbi:MAG TPA: FAD-dependent oxidoreductase, partial [Acidimicrobiales bacterium]|nr:FAD-dependent oxidoreductase [Acidimicrobiales bacterium]
MAAPPSRPGPGGPLPRPTVVVVGGGIAGLSAALALASAPGAPRVVVLEASARLGGKLASAEIGGRTVDLGPDAFLARRPEAVDLCRELGLGPDLVAPGRRNAFVLARGRLRPLPDGLALGVPTRLAPLARSGILSPPGLARAALDLASPGRGPSRPPGSVPDRAVAAVTTARLGREVTELLVDPLVGGIHAGDTARMSAAAVFPPLLEAAPGHSLMRALRPPGPAAAPEGPV